MSDELNYTVNDPSQVECPYCHKSMDLAAQLLAVYEYDTACQHCGRSITLQIEHEITVVAWKPEAME
jgi:hypothetical protein